MRALTWFGLAIAFVLQAGPARGQDQLQLPAAVREWYRNPDGSCVQCSIGMCGCWQNLPAAETLLWDSEYGPAVRGGSNPSRVTAYCDQRQIPAYNVTGSENTFGWMDWACRTGRTAAIGAGSRHFQTLLWHDEQNNVWYVCDNNSPQTIDRYTDRQFRQLHLASGPWCVILDTPAPPAMPRYVKWW